MMVDYLVRSTRRNIHLMSRDEVRRRQSLLAVLPYYEDFDLPGEYERYQGMLLAVNLAALASAEGDWGSCYHFLDDYLSFVADDGPRYDGLEDRYEFLHASLVESGYFAEAYDDGLDEFRCSRCGGLQACNPGCGTELDEDARYEDIPF